MEGVSFLDRERSQIEGAKWGEVTSKERFGSGVPSFGSRLLSSYVRPSAPRTVLSGAANASTNKVRRG